MVLIASTMSWMTLALYVAAGIVMIYQVRTPSLSLGTWGRVITFAGMTAHTTSLLAGAVAARSLLYTGTNMASLSAWALVVLYGGLAHRLRLRAYGAFVMPTAAAIMAFAVFTGGEGGATGLAPYGAASSFAVGLHVVLIVAGNAGFLIGGLSTLLDQYLSRQLKSRRTSRFSRRLPAVTQLRTAARRAISLAFPVYSAGLAVGVLQVAHTDVVGWWADPRVMLSGMVWLTFAAYLLAAPRSTAPARLGNGLAIAGVVLVLALGLAARTLPVGFHVFAVS